jgi:glycosyltransferase involved in cell wall biosynthesis
MRILFLASDFPNNLLPTRGPFNRALVDALSQGHDVRIVNPVPWVVKLKSLGTGGLTARETSGKLEIWHPTYWYPPKFGRSGYHNWMLRSIRGSVAEATKDWKPDVILSYWAHPDGAAGAILAQEMGVASAVIVGGSDVLLVTEDAARRNAVSDALSSVDAVVTVNNHLKLKVEELGVEPSKIHVWSQGVDKQIFSPGDRKEARGRRNIDAEQKLFICVARLVPVKGIDILLQACQTVRQRGKEFKLVILGDGPLLSTLQAQAKELGVEDIVKFAGPRKPSGLADWYRAADRTILPSRSEGLPNVLRESLACGTHFIATEVGGIREIAGPGDVLVAPENPFELAEAMIAAITATDPLPAPPSLPDWSQSAESLVNILSALPPDSHSQPEILQSVPTQTHSLKSA